MKKKLLSLVMALVLCASLTIPALADAGDLWYMYPNGDCDNVLSDRTGENWSYKDDTNTLTLSGVTDMIFSMNFLYQGSPTIVLAPGTKNTLKSLDVDSLWDIPENATLTIKGTGELIIYNASPEGSQENGVLSGCFAKVDLQDGLTITGGTKEGDSSELTLVKGESEYGTHYAAGSTPATYIRIAPAKTESTGTTATTGTTAAPKFTDVAATSPFASAIDWAVEQGITNGTTATTFGPGNTCTVSHILTFLWRANGKPGAAEGVSDSASAAKWAVEQEMIEEGADVSVPCTRSAAVTYMWKAAGSPAPSKAASFSDVTSDAGCAQAVSWAVEKGITSGTSATAFSPDNNCTRGQIVTFLFRAAAAQQ